MNDKHTGMVVGRCLVLINTPNMNKLVFCARQGAPNHRNNRFGGRPALTSLNSWKPSLTIPIFASHLRSCTAERFEAQGCELWRSLQARSKCWAPPSSGSSTATSGKLESAGVLSGLCPSLCFACVSPPQTTDFEQGSTVKLRNRLRIGIEPHRISAAATLATSASATVGSHHILRYIWKAS